MGEMNGARRCGRRGDCPCGGVNCTGQDGCPCCEAAVLPLRVELVHACPHVVAVAWEWVEPAPRCENGCKEHARREVHQMVLS